MKPEKCPDPKRKGWALCWYCWVVYGYLPDECPWKQKLKKRGIEKLEDLEKK